MGRTFLFLIVLFLMGILPHPPAYAEAVSSPELINNARQYDGKTVTFRGEVVGERMDRGRYAWVNVHDGSNAIGIWMHRELAREIRFAGSYKAKGDLVEVSGIFRRSCPEHGGDLDIHAQSLVVQRVGMPVYKAPAVRKLHISLLFFAACLLIFLLKKAA